VVYLIADGPKTLLAIGVAAGPEAPTIQAVLDSCIRTIEREG